MSSSRKKKPAGKARKRKLPSPKPKAKPTMPPTPKGAPRPSFQPIYSKPAKSVNTEIPSVFELPAARFESIVQGATQRQLMIGRAALASVCRHWNVQPDPIYGDHRRPHELQARTRLCQALAEHAGWSWTQIATYLRRRSKSFVSDQIAQAKTWPIKDKYYDTRAERVERDVLAAIAEIDEALSSAEGGEA